MGKYKVICYFRVRLAICIYKITGQVILKFMLHLKKKKKYPWNYRPISSLPYLDEIFDRSIYNHHVSLSNEYSLLNDVQFGFRKARSTSDAMIKFIENVYTSLDNCGHHVSVLIDLKKAFDSIDYSVIISKAMWTMGTIWDSLIVTWFGS